MNPAPIPWILCGPGCPPDITGDEMGSTATAFKSGFLGLRAVATPVTVSYTHLTLPTKA